MNSGIFSVGLIKDRTTKIPDILFRSIFVHPNFKTIERHKYDVGNVRTEDILAALQLPETEIKHVEEELQIFLKMAPHFQNPQIIALSMNIPKDTPCISWEERHLLRALLGVENPPYILNYSHLIDVINSPVETWES